MANYDDNNLQSKLTRPYYKGENMIAVMSGQHNSGKTWLTISLAQALSAMKQRVLLFDGSGGLGNVKKQLGLNEVCDLDKVIYDGACLNQIVTSYSKGRFDVLLSNPSSSGLSTMSIGCLQIFGDDLNIISQDYDKLLLDIDVSESNAAKVLAGMSKSIIIVCNDTISSIKSGYRIITDFYNDYPQTNIYIVINRSENYIDGKRAYENLAATCNLYLNRTPSLLGIVREDARIRDAIRNQTTTLNRYPQSEAALDILSIAKEILK